MFTELERKNLAKQYVPLVKKIVNQYCGKNELDYEEIEGFAWEGFVIAMNNYDENRSKLSFQQYAGWGIRNGILNGINTASRTIKLSYYKQKQMRDKGEDLPSAKSIDSLLAKCDLCEDHITELGTEDDYDKEINHWEVLINALNSEFEKEWVDMFCSIYGLNGCDVIKSKDLASQLGVSTALITIRKNKMIDFIKSKPELLEMLRELL